METQNIKNLPGMKLCGRCKNASAGSYCSHCGANLKATKRSPYLRWLVALAVLALVGGALTHSDPAPAPVKAAAPKTDNSPASGDTGTNAAPSPVQAAGQKTEPAPAGGDTGTSAAPSSVATVSSAEPTHEERLANLRKKRENLEGAMYVEREMSKKLQRDLLNLNNQPLPDPAERRYLFDQIDKQSQRNKNLLDEVEKIDAEIAREVRELGINAKDGLRYLWIPPGTFTMGCSQGDTECMESEKPAHQVSITKGFRLGQTEVTQAAYQLVMGRKPDAQRATFPVDNVSWIDAAAYCRNIGGRLPTEAEWEYAARGGSNLPRYGDLDQVAWYTGNSTKTTHPVRQKQPNGYGLYDMLGNVSEWTADWFGTDPTGAVSDPKGPITGQKRVLRGGSFGDVSGTVRTSLRGWDDPLARYDNYGFRCVEEPQ